MLSSNYYALRHGQTVILTDRHKQRESEAVAHPPYLKTEKGNVHFMEAPLHFTGYVLKENTGKPGQSVTQP